MADNRHVETSSHQGDLSPAIRGSFPPSLPVVCQIGDTESGGTCLKWPGITPVNSYHVFSTALREDHKN